MRLGERAEQAREAANAHFSDEIDLYDRSVKVIHLFKTGEEVTLCDQERMSRDLGGAPIMEEGTIGEISEAGYKSSTFPNGLPILRIQWGSGYSSNWYWAYRFTPVLKACPYCRSSIERIESDKGSFYVCTECFRKIETKEVLHV